MKLTERFIDTFYVVGDARDRVVFDDVQRGLAVRVTDKASRSYFAQYTLKGRKSKVPIGSCDAITLADARSAAAIIMGQVARGQDPAKERQEAIRQAKLASAATSLDDLICRWERLHLARKRPRYAREASRALRRAFSKHLGRPANVLDRDVAVRILDNLIKTAPQPGPGIPGTIDRPASGASISSRTGSYGRALYSWALRRGEVATNPFANLPFPGPNQRRDRKLSDEELTKVWKSAPTVGEAYGKLVLMLILTGQRREEVAGMRWSEISDDLRTWHIPAGRVKNSKGHNVPLSSGARRLIRGQFTDDAYLNRLRAIDALVFPGKRNTTFSGWSKSKRELDEVVSIPAWRIHDLRRTVATGLQKLGVRLEVTEAILNHLSGTRSGIVAVYQVHDWATEKAVALEAWAARLDDLIAKMDRQDTVVRAIFG